MKFSFTYCQSIDWLCDIFNVQWFDIKSLPLFASDAIHWLTRFFFLRRKLVIPCRWSRSVEKVMLVVSVVQIVEGASSVKYAKICQ